MARVLDTLSPAYLISVSCLHLDLATALNLISTLAIVGALVFTGMQVREANRARRDQAAIAVIQTTQSESWTRALSLVAALPANAGHEDIIRNAADTPRALLDIGVRLETIAYMVFVRTVPLQTVIELIGGVVLLFWSRAEAWTEEERTRTGNDKWLEWCEWLADRVEERQAKGAAVPAYLRERRWQE